MATPTIKDSTPAPVTVWSGGSTNPFGYVNLTTTPEFAWDGIYGTGGTVTITLTSPDGRTDVGTLTDPNALGSLGFKWDGATNTYTEQSYNGPHPGVLQGAGSLLRGLLYTAPVLAAGDTLTVMAQISYTSAQLATINYAPTPNEPVPYTVSNSGPVIIQISGEKPATGPIQIGTGADTFTLGISEDAYQGDTQFLITVDGKQYGGVQTATASHKAGESQPFVINGNFGRGWHTYSVNFLNDLDSASDTTSRNLYVDSATYNGFRFPDSGLSLLANGTASRGFDPLVITPPAIGSGPDSFTFILSEDAYRGDAQFVVTIDGQQQGGVQTITALHAAGQTQVVEVKGDFGAASDHTAAITFLNDTWGGSAAADRNLYVDLVTFNDSILGITPFKGALFNDGSLSFLRPGTGPDKLVVSLSEDAYQGDAVAEVTVDGRVLGQVTVTALHSAIPQDFAFSGSFGPGPHTLSVSFLNDTWGGSDAADRNLYVAGISYNSVNHPEATASLFSAEIVTFAV